MAANSVDVLDELMRALPYPAVLEQMGALKARLLSEDGEVAAEATPSPFTELERERLATPRSAVPSFISARHAAEEAERAEPEGITATYYY